MRAPGASLAAIFAALGSIPILCISGLSIRFFSRESLGAPLPVVLLVSFFSAFLLWGNESRQFVAIVPVMLLFSLYICRENLYASILTLIAAIATLPIGHPIADSMRVAIATGADFSKPTWQSYFGRQGPWMSDTSIALYLGIVCVFTLLVSSTLQKNAGKVSL